MLRRHFLAAFLAAPPIRLGIVGTGNRGSSLAAVIARIPNIEIVALCDLDPTRTARTAARIPAHKPLHYTSHKPMLDQRGLDAVLIATSQQAHSAIAVDALHQGKAVLSEVCAAVTIEQCWQLVEAVERYRGFYMMAENCCYYRSNLAVLAMAQAGRFGDITYADCGYIHSIPHLGYTSPGHPTWRGELMRDYANWYPTHAIGPVAQWLGIGSSDRFATITTMATPAARIVGTIPYHSDANTSLIQTTGGKVIELRLDTVSARPSASTTHYHLQGTKGAFRDTEGRKQIWLEGTHPENAWGEWAPYESQYDHASWRAESATASTTGHGGADWFTLRAFFEALALKQPSPIDVYAAAEWTSIISLSTASVKAKGQPQSFPDFRRNQKSK